MKRGPKLLIVDDGDRYVELAHALMRNYGYATRCELEGPCWSCPQRVGCDKTHAHDARELDEALEKHPDVDAVLLDVAFRIPEERLLPSTEPDLDRRRRYQGLEILAHLRRTRGALPVVLMSSLEEIEHDAPSAALAADELVTLAGSDAFDARALDLLVTRVLARTREAPEAGGYAFGRSAAMARVRRDALTLARTSLPMLLLGETGTGKSALAERVIHPATGRAGPFVPVDLAAIPATLVAAELFGTARGAFSGAVDREGMLERANGGTLFLDEIGNLPLDVQRMLLLTLQDRRVTRLGEAKTRPVDIKLVAATNADLDRLVDAGQFRGDLHARLNPAARIVLPPLRERREDLLELLFAFVRKTFASGADRALLVEYVERLGPGVRPHAELAIGAPDEGDSHVTFVLSRPSLAAIRAHPFAGNVRELELFAANATVFALSDALGATSAHRAIPIPSRLVRELLGAPSPGRAAPEPGKPGLTPRPRLRDVANALEADLYARLYRDTGGDFVAMARTLLQGDPAANARRVRLRFNQLGLKARTLRKTDE